MNLTSISSAVFRIPGVERGFVQQMEDLTEDRKTPVHGSPGVWICGNRRLTTYRAWLVYKGEFGEKETPWLRVTLVDVFKTCGIDLAGEIAEAEKMREETALRTPPSDAHPKERAELMADWQHKCAALKETAEILGKLKTWLEEKV